MKFFSRNFFSKGLTNEKQRSIIKTVDRSVTTNKQRKEEMTMTKMTWKEAMMYDIKEFFTDPYKVGLVWGVSIIVAGLITMGFAISCLV